jgi:putative heme-binding domain-containing protein
VERFLVTSALELSGCARCAALFLLLTGLPGDLGAQTTAPAGSRVPWSTSRVIGSPDPRPPFKVVRAFENLKFEKPLVLVRCASSDRLFVGEQPGAIYSFKNVPDAKAELFFDLRKDIQTLELHPNAQGIESLYGFVFHPQFATNRQCFACYTLRRKEGRGPNLVDGTRVSRFTVTDTDPPRIDPASEEIVITFLQGGHNGGDLHFGPDEMLYISTGDAASPNPPDPFETGQDISDLLSSILRIDIDRKDPEKNYAIPPDNPFVKLPGARPEVWSYGFRNPWRMSFDRQTGQLLVGDVGWELWEMVYRIEKGGNYGWSAMEGPQPIKPGKVGPTPILPPLIELPHTIAASVTGGYVYRGRKFPELVGAYVFGDWETRRLWAARFDGDRVAEMPEITRPSVRIGAFGEDNEGEIYFLDHDGGTIHTLARNEQAGANVDFPVRLSETGIFEPGVPTIPAPGVLPLEINARRWQDGATAEHWVAFPGDSSATLYSPAKPIPGMVNWHNFRLHFPSGAVLVKTISLAGRRLETQLLHFDGEDWQPYAYAWRDDQSDAELVPADGDEKELKLDGRQVVWQFHSRSQCRSCHSSWSEYALAFQPEQLNRPGTDDRNQLVALSELGLIRRASADGKPLPAFDDQSAAKERRFANPMDESEPLEARARAYLHANCGHCHTNGGGGAVDLRLSFPTPVPDMKAVNVLPARGTFGLPEPHIIKPGDPASSTLYFRMAKFGRDRMPHLGAEQPDEQGLRLIEQWIASLPASAETASSGSVSKTPAELFADTKLAIILARKLARGELKAEHRQLVIAEAEKLTPGPIRDLFEGYLPDDGRGRRLGTSPRPKAILSLAGDRARGETLFWSQAVNCGACHKVGERGTSVGPDLSQIGKQRAREDLLASVLEPSRRVEPKFASYVVQTVDGRVLTGVLVSRDESQAVLRDGQNKEYVLPTHEIEALKPSVKSLMPEGQIAGLTAQDAADLLEYLIRCQ